MSTAQPSQPESDTTPAADAAHAVPAPVLPPVEKKKGGLKKALAIAVILVIGLGVKIGLNSLLSADPVSAKAGNCVHVTGNDVKATAEVVDCGSDKANYSVVSVLQNSVDMNACSTVDGANSAFVEQVGSAKQVLCLAKK